MKNEIILKKVSKDFAMNSPEGDYNVLIWKKKIERLEELEAEIYADSSGLIYAVYKLNDGLLIFSQVTLHSCIHNGGFTRVIMQTLPDGSIKSFKKGFGKAGNERVVNTKAGRKWLADNICRYDIPVTND